MTKRSPRPIHKIYYHSAIKLTLEEKALSFIFEQAKSFLDAALPQKYSAYTGLARYMFGLDLKPHEILKRELKRSIDNTLYRLQEKGLIYKNKKGENVFWKLTKKGEKFLNNIKQGQIIQAPEDNITRVFVFDIPEKKKILRNLIRRELVGCGYKMLQRSVWIGKRPLPYSFLVKIKESGLFENIHLFEVKEEGTLGDLIIDKKEDNI